MFVVCFLSFDVGWLRADRVLSVFLSCVARCCVVRCVLFVVACCVCCLLLSCVVHCS